MSFGDNDNTGNDKKNYPFQYAVLKLLKLISSGSGGPGVQQIPGIDRVTAAGTLLAGTYKSIAIYNSGASSGTVNGKILKAGEKVGWTITSSTNTLDVVAYDASSTEFLITTLT